MELKISTRTLARIFWVFAVVLGLAQVWNYRYVPSTDDSISYLDIADAYLRGDWHSALNAHWSPLYSWILALVFLVAKPSLFWEMPVVKLLNFAIFLAAMAAFAFFLRQLIRYHDRLNADREPQHRSLRVPEWVWVVAGYSLFLWSSLKWTPVYSDTPDMLTAGLIYVAMGLLLRIRVDAAGWLIFALLGTVLGFAYLSKSPLLPLSLVFLVVALFSAGSMRHALPRVAVAGVLLALVAGPFIVALSLEKGRFTFGNAGEYVYATFVNPGFPIVPLIHWQGEPPEFGTPVHPTRQIADLPEAFEFETPLSGTYPPWYEPAYWYEGLKLQFSFKQQMKILAQNLVFCWRHFLGALLFGYLLLVVAGGRPVSAVTALKDSWPIILPAVAAFGIYCLVTDLLRSDILNQPAMRYLSPFVVLLFAGVFVSVRLPDTESSSRWLSGIMVAAAIATGIGVMTDAIWYRTWREFTRTHFAWNVAESLATAGVSRGDRIARVGNEYPYWARLSGARIIAEIPNGTKFWAESAASRASALQAVRKTGAKVVVAAYKFDKPEAAIEEGWRQLSETVYIYSFACESGQHASAGCSQPTSPSESIHRP